MLWAVGLVLLFPKVLGEDFPSLITANASLAVVLDRQYLGDKYQETLDDLKEYIKELTRVELKQGGGVNVHYYSWSTISLKKGFLAVFSIASCDDTWSLFSRTEEEELLLFALTEVDCPRLPSKSAITVTYTDVGHELPQILLDLRTTRGFNWKSAVILHDETLSRDMISRVMQSLTSQIEDDSVSSVSVSVFKMKHETNEYLRRKEMRRVLNKLPVKNIGENFIAVVTSDMMATMAQTARDLLLSHTQAQWLYVISDTSSRSGNLSSFINALYEGENIAYIYNVSDSSPDCKNGFICYSHELLGAFVSALDSAIQEEFHVAAQVSDEEWEAIRPSKSQRKDMLLKHMQQHLIANNVCGNCSSWRALAADTWGSTYRAFTETSVNIRTSHHTEPNDTAARAIEHFELLEVPKRNYDCSQSITAAVDEDRDIVNGNHNGIDQVTFISMNFIDKVLQDTSESYTHPFHDLFFESESESSDSLSSDSDLDQEIETLTTFVKALKKRKLKKSSKVIVRMELDDAGRVTGEEERNVELVSLKSNPESFQEKFRMLPSTFEELLKVVAPNIPKESLSKTSAGKQLLATLMFMGIPKKAPYREVAIQLGVPTSAVIQSVHRVINILASLSKTYITWPTGAKAKSVMQRFREISSIPCVIGSLNSSLIKYGKGHALFNIGENTVHMQVVSDDEYRFTYVFAGCTGSWSKKDVFDISTLNSSEQYFDADDYHVVANNSYPLYRNVMVPFIDPEDPLEQLYNMYISEALTVVDEAIALLKNRVNAFNYLDFSVDGVVISFIEAACVVHNFCLLHNDMIQEDILDVDKTSKEEIKQERYSDEITHDFESEAEEKRLAIVEHLANLSGIEMG